jgi:hypothetical protein
LEVKTVAKMVVCAKCFRESLVDSEFCSSCGASLAGAREAARAADEQARFAATLLLETGSIDAAKDRLNSELQGLSKKVRTLLTDSTARVPSPNTSDWVREMKARIEIDPDREELTPLEAYRLQYEMNCNIVSGGIQWNARQVELLQKSCLGEEETQEFYRAYNAYYRSKLAGPWNGRFWIILAAAALMGCLSAMPTTMSAWRYIVLAISIWGIAWARGRMVLVNAHWDGYCEGHADGKRAGVVAGIGLDEDESELTERAREMQLFEEQFPEFAGPWAQLREARTTHHEVATAG